ncbi:MAG TPA: hypothetical protein VG963_22385 [Polyangiaceae bacterium]|nr:hypothetical protein [Polyangiaceae bacterium]
MTPFDPSKGKFVLRYEQLPNGELQLTVDLPDFGSIGPIHLEEKLARELGELLERSKELLAEAHERTRRREELATRSSTASSALAKVIRLVRPPPRGRE